MAKEKEKEAVLAAAHELFSRSKATDEVTLEEIAKAAQLDIKQVKALYASPDQILEEMVCRDIEESSELFTKVINDRGKADIKLTRLVRELLTRYQKSFFLFKVMSIGVDESSENDFVHQRVRDEYVERYRQNTAILGRLIAQGQSENLFTDIDPLEAAYLLRGMISAALRYRRMTGRDDDIRDHADTVMRVFLKGLLR